MSSLRIFSSVKKIDKSSFIYRTAIIMVLLLLMAILFILSVLYGSAKISLGDIFNTIFTKDTESITYQIISYVRLPRATAALLAGMALATAGVVLQSLMDNPLAGPNIIGVNSGAGLSALIIMILFPKLYFFLPIAAFVGAFLTSLLIFFIAYKTGASRIAIVLAGVAISSFLSAGIDTLTILFPDRVVAATSYMIGGFSGVTFREIGYAVFYIIAALIFSIFLAPSLNILALGDETALSLGMNVAVYRFIFIVLAALLAGSAVSFSGLLGFVGLIVPHASRFLVGYDNRYLIPVSALMGACFVMVCDLLARILFAPYEIPVGIIMSFLGGPFFVWLLISQRRRGLSG